MKQQDIFASTQILTFNPILNESVDVRIQYFLYLTKLIHLIKWDKRKYTKAQIALYKEKLCDNQEISIKKQKTSFDSRYCYLLPYDIALITGFHTKLIKSDKIKAATDTIVSDFSLSKDNADFLVKEFEAALGNLSSWDDVLQSTHAQEYKQYLEIVRKNIGFIKKEPYKILITATMSAGKSTLINALVGKNISLMQNMACTSKIHTIISKPFEDGVTSECDHEILLDASKDALLNDNDENKSAKITVGTYFNSELGGKRIILLDSPGVNSSEDIEHTEISQQIIESKKYNLMLYVLNATQLGTNDDERHLEAVRERLGHTNIVFVMNKVDQLISDDDNILDSIESQRKFLVSKGYDNPIICPVSSRAAYLVKKSRNETLSRLEQREIENYMDKFELQSLSAYYEQNFMVPHFSPDNETDALFVNCGFAYLEKNTFKYIQRR